MNADYTPSGVKIEGAYENDRNAAGSQLFKDILRECFNVQDVIVGHHLIYVYRDTRADGFTYEVVQELPSADALIFDHEIARRIWGEEYLCKLRELACTPPETRDKVLATLFYGRDK